MLHYEGLDILLRGLAKARTELPALQGRLVGDGPEEGRLRRLAQDLSVPVVFTGRVPHAEIPCRDPWACAVALRLCNEPRSARAWSVTWSRGGKS
jgi:glycosyltransferase involved in cell wall biosynthesis